jgi:hypothetical protein
LQWGSLLSKLRKDSEQATEPMPMLGLNAYIDSDHEKHLKAHQAAVEALKASQAKLANPGIFICNHQWKRYNGFTESYDYCELCDAKRGKE